MATAKKMTLKLVQDNDCQDPRNWDNLGVMVCAHKRYNLGDENGLNKAVRFIKEHVSETTLENIGFDEDHVPSVQEALELTGKVIVLPLYLYDHSGITMKTTPFSCRWDSGQVGFIYLPKEAAFNEYGWKRMSPKRTEKVMEILTAEVTVYDQYLTGDVWGFQLNVEDEETDSCWGFFGSDPETNGILDHLCDDAKKLVQTQQYERVYA
jgi:hypothetical protein